MLSLFYIGITGALVKPYAVSIQLNTYSVFHLGSASGTVICSEEEGLTLLPATLRSQSGKRKEIVT